jgi:hypothetical protein
MQARELTSEEIAEGSRGITEQQLNATQIQALVRQMDNSKKRHRALRGTPQYEEALKSENTTLYFNYPSLFNLHITDKLDQTFFEMLALKRKIERGEITSEQASSFVGQQLYQRYVPHVLSNAPPPEPRLSYSDFYKQNSNA